jgi:hypothetical protein
MTAHLVSSPSPMYRGFPAKSIYYFLFLMMFFSGFYQILITKTRSHVNFIVNSNLIHFQHRFPHHHFLSNSGFYCRKFIQVRMDRKENRVSIVFS